MATREQKISSHPLTALMIIEAIDGDDAVSKFIENKDRIQFLLLDVIMPKKDGRKVLEEITKIKPDIKMIFMSGYPADFVRSRGIVEEGLTIISKPISPEELFRKIRETLDQ